MNLHEYDQTNKYVLALMRLSRYEQELWQSNEWSEVVKELVDKDISKKPTTERCNIYGDYHLACPKCQNTILFTTADPNYKPKHCFNCGQRLDWSKEHDKKL